MRFSRTIALLIVGIGVVFACGGCSTATGVSKGNIFYSDRNPNIRIQVDPSLKPQEPFTYEVNQKGGDFAGTVRNTTHPFAEIEGKDVKRAFVVVFRDLPDLTHHWTNAGAGKEKNIGGVTFRIYPLGNFVEPGLAKEATIRGFDMKGRYSAVLFNKVVTRQRLLVLAYIEKAPTEFEGMYWEKDRMTDKQKEYLEQIEQRATDAFTVTSYSVF